MDSLAGKDEKASEERLGSSGLMDRLHHVRKRKRAFSGQRFDADAIKRLLREERGSARGD